MSKPVVLTKNDCVNCDKTKALFDTLGVEYDVVTEEEGSLQKIMELGFRAAPVVITDDAKWVGFNEKAIRDYASGDVWD